MKKSFVVFLLVLITCLFSFSSVFAAGSKDTGGYTFSVSVPMSMPISKDAETGIVITSNELYIANYSQMKVKVSNVQVNVANGWELAPFGTDFSEEVSDSKKFTLQINNEAVDTDGMLDLYEGNWGTISVGGDLPLRYDAAIAMNESIEEKIATVTFTVDPEDGYDPTDPDFPGVLDPPGNTVKDITPEDEESKLWEYIIDPNTNTANVVYYYGEYGPNIDLVVPSSFEGARTVSIGGNLNAWSNRELRSLTIPQGVDIGIENGQFTNLKIRRLIIEAGCTVEPYTFARANIGILTITDSTLRANAFYANNIDMLGIFGNTNYSEKPFTFSTADDTKIRYVETSCDIPDSAFTKTGVQEVHILPGCSSIGMRAFSFNNSIDILTGLLENIKYIGLEAFDQSFTENGVHSISSMTLKGCTIEYGAFGGSFSVDSLSIDDCIVNGAVFRGTSKMKPITLGSLSVKNTSFSSGIVMNVVVDEVGIYEGVEYKGNAFSGSTLNYLETTINIPTRAFEGSTVKNVNFLDGCTSISNYGFYNINSIESFSGLERITSVGMYAFSGSFSQEVTIPEIHLTNCTVDLGGFSGTLKATNIILDTCTLTENVFTGEKVIENLILTDCTFGYRKVEFNNLNVEFLGLYGNTAYTVYSFGSSTGKAFIKFFETSANIPDFAFSNKSVDEIHILEGCTSIGTQAFYNNTVNKISGLDSVAVNIQSKAFADCNNLLEVYLSKDCKYLADSFPETTQIIILSALSDELEIIEDEVVPGDEIIDEEASDETQDSGFSDDVVQGDESNDDVPAVDEPGIEEPVEDIPETDEPVGDESGDASTGDIIDQPSNDEVDDDSDSSQDNDVTQPEDNLTDVQPDEDSEAADPDVDSEDSLIDSQPDEDSEGDEAIDSTEDSDDFEGSEDVDTDENFENGMSDTSSNEDSDSSEDSNESEQSDDSSDTNSDDKGNDSKDSGSADIVIPSDEGKNSSKIDSEGSKSGNDEDASKGDLESDTAPKGSTSGDSVDSSVED